jgi:hypothetical protein
MERGYVEPTAKGGRDNVKANRASESKTTTSRSNEASIHKGSTASERHRRRLKSSQLESTSKDSF